MDQYFTDNANTHFSLLLEELRAVGTERTFRSGDTIYYQGDAGRGVSLVISGSVGLMSVTPEGDALWIGHAHQGHILGDVASLSNEPQAYEVTASTPVNVVSVTQTALQALLTRKPSLYAPIARSLASKYNALANQFIAASSLSARGRICAELIRLAKPNGISPNSCVIRPVPMFSKLGEQIGTSRETVSRTVSSLQKQGLLLRTPGAIVIENLTAMKAEIK